MKPRRGKTPKQGKQLDRLVTENRRKGREYRKHVRRLATRAARRARLIQNLPEVTKPPGPGSNTVGFRAYWGAWLNKPEVREYMAALALMPTSTGISMFKLITERVIPFLSSEKLVGAQPQEVRIILGSNGNEVQIPYWPQAGAVYVPTPRPTVQ